MSKLNKLPVKQEVIHKLAIGEPQTSIAEQMGVYQSTVSRFPNNFLDEKIEEWIKTFLIICKIALMRLY